MGRLKVLPATVANMIAAGEVVQRPSSVVKELMENAVDAGASSVTINVVDAGRTLIQVIDNGEGMSAEDATVCFERHATSKIAVAEDLENILTYGFRGEALASIASIAEITLKTRRQEDETGTCVRISDYGKMESSPTSCPTGCNFQVRNLFYNTPARRKFLKSDNVELKHILEEFTRIALTKPEIGFSITSNGKDIYVLKPAKSLKFRILDLMGTSTASNMVDLDAETSLMRISGFIGKPDAAKKTTGNQFFFINGRYFRSAYLHKAVMKAYEELIPDGLTPSYFIYLQADPHSIDVNIHPTKTEIKFEEESLVFQTVYACVHETIGKSQFSASIDFDTEGSVTMPQLSRSFEEYKGIPEAPSVSVDESYNPFSAPKERGFDSGYRDFSSHIDARDDYGKLFEQKTLPSTQTLIIQGKFILTTAKSGVMAINIRRAYERIIYEQALRALSEESHVTQTALFPIQVKVGVPQRLLIDDNSEMLGRLGFDISAFGDDTVVVNGVPEGYSCEPGKVQEMVQDLILILSDGESGLEELMRQKMALKFAILGASNAAAVNSAVDAQRLLDTLFSCDNSDVTAGGKRIITIIPVEELEKKF